MRVNAITLKTINDLTLYFRAESKDKDENGLPEFSNVERLRAVMESEDDDAVFEAEDLHGDVRTVPAKEIARYEVDVIEDTAIIGH